MKYRVNYDFGDFKKGDIVPRDSDISWNGIFFTNGSIGANDANFNQLLKTGIITEVPEVIPEEESRRMVEINGKLFSESTIKQALKDYIED